MLSAETHWENHDASGEVSSDRSLYNYFRTYDPATGRYLEADPIGQRGGLNPYVYAASNPLALLDPSGLTTLDFSVRSGRLRVDPEQPGRDPYEIPATSGRGSCLNNPACQGQHGEGPLPAGVYELVAAEISDPGLAQDLVRNLFPGVAGDWGDWRVPLHPDPNTDTLGRSGFKLHGGSLPGSAGCIDIGGGILGSEDTDRLLQDLRNDSDGRVPLRVR